MIKTVIWILVVLCDAYIAALNLNNYILSIRYQEEPRALDLMKSILFIVFLICVMFKGA